MVLQPVWLSQCLNCVQILAKKLTGLRLSQSGFAASPDLSKAGHNKKVTCASSWCKGACISIKNANIKKISNWEKNNNASKIRSILPQRTQSKPWLVCATHTHTHRCQQKYGTVCEILESGSTYLTFMTGEK